MKSGLKVKRRQEKRVKSREKNLDFFFHIHMRFYAGGRNFINKKGLFYANFFEFEVKTHPSFKPHHTVVHRFQTGWFRLRFHYGPAPSFHKKCFSSAICLNFEFKRTIKHGKDR